jgi:hypothetical protein
MARKPVLSLAAYRSMCETLPLPTEEQMDAFALFVSDAHSWYKHLSLFPPGVAFRFFLDPSAGMQRIITADGHVNVEERTERGFHYSWIPTAEYRKKYGYMAFSQSNGTRAADASNSKRVKVSSDGVPEVYDPRRQALVRLPGEVVVAGTALITGLVHVGGSQSLRYWFHWLDRVEWPEESGGQETLTKIYERCELLARDPGQTSRLSAGDPRLREEVNLLFADYPLYELVLPERKRQLASMVAAMRRICTLVWS